jgi:hypothetical protein
MEFLQEIWGEIKEFAGIYSITTTWNFDIEQNVLSNFIKLELDNRYTDLKSIFKLGLKRDQWCKLLKLNYHNRRYVRIHKRYMDSLLSDIDRDSEAYHNFCPIYIFMNYIYTNIEDFKHQEWFIEIYKRKVYTLIGFYGDQNNDGKYDVLMELLYDIRDNL